MKQADLDKLVLRYLKKRRLTKAESIFREEAKLPDSISMDVITDISIFEELLLFSVADGAASRFVHEYDCLAAWVDASLDLYKGELSQVLWPVFVQCYTSLVTRGAASEAQQLMNLGGPRFKSPALGGRYTRELERLQAAAVPHLMGASMGGDLAADRVQLTLTRFSLNLLLTFLHATRLTLILSVINQHTALQVADGPPGDVSSEGPHAEAQAFANSQQQVAAFNSASTLELGILQGSVEDLWHTIRAATVEEDAAGGAPQVGQDGKPLSKKARASLQRAAQLAKAAQAEEAVPRVHSSLPLPDSALTVTPALEADLQARGEVSGSALPSCAFFTLVNTAQSLNCAAFTADSTKLVGGFADSTVRLYDLQRLGRSAGDSTSGERSGSEPGAACRVLYGHSGAVCGVDASPEGDLLFSGSADGTVRVWGAEAGAALAAFKGHMFPVWDVAACPSGTYVASASADTTARLWTTERSSAVRLFVGHTADVEVVEWHPTCSYLATGSSDGSVRMWDVVSGAPLRIFVGLRSPVTALAFSPDGRKLVIGCYDGEVSVWDTASAHRMAACRQHTASVWTVAVSRGEGSLVASGSADGTMRLWNLAEPPPQPPRLAASPHRSALSLGVLAPLKKYRTKATPIVCLHWSHRNLIMGTGALTLPRLRRS